MVAYRNPMIASVSAILEERLRQLHDLGHTQEHDAEAHAQGCLARAAAARLVVAASRALPPESAALAQDLRNMAIVLDPWSSAPSYLKAPTERLLVEAGALSAAELERVGSGGAG